MLVSRDCRSRYVLFLTMELDKDIEDKNPVSGEG